MKFRQLHPIVAQARRRISALYVTGDKANENYAVLTPYMEFSKTLTENQDSLRDNVAKRRLNMDVDAALKSFELFKSKHLYKAELEAKRDAIANELKQMQKSNPDKSFAETRKQEAIKLRNDLKMLKEEMYPIEDDFMHKFLKLPNDLHRETPANELKLLYRQGLPKEDTSSTKINHLDRKDIIDYRDPTCYYLMKEAAHFDYHTPLSCVRRFFKHGYVQFVNPDFARTLLLEAATVDLNRVEILEEEDIKESKVNLLHLTGGASLASFLGFVTKLSIFPSLLPLRFIASGREYWLPSDSAPSKGLYTAAQSSSVQLFISAKDEIELEQEIEVALNETIDIFREFNTHFRIVYTTADNLTEAESLRASIQMYSPYYNDYIEVGHLSNYTNFISKRILFNYKENKSFKFPYIAAGSNLNVTKILACLVENQSPLTIPFSKEEINNEAIKKFKNLFS